MTTVQAVTAARSTSAALGQLLRLAAGPVSWVAGWVARHWLYVLACVLVAVLAARLGRPGGEALAVLAVVVPALTGAVWARWRPVSYERLAAGPSRRLGWRRWARRQWPDLARECGLAVQRTRRPWLRLVSPFRRGRRGRPGRHAWTSRCGCIRG